MELIDKAQWVQRFVAHLVSLWPTESRNNIVAVAEGMWTVGDMPGVPEHIAQSTYDDWPMVPRRVDTESGHG